jgi:biopolymer transport protein ExbD
MAHGHERSIMKSLTYNRRRYGEPIQFLMTPLIDVTVLVISFFILAGTFASIDAIQHTVPTVHGNQPVQIARMGDKLVINVPPRAASGTASPVAEARSYIIGGQIISPGDTATLIDRLKQEREMIAAARAGAAVPVEVRADKNVDFMEIAPVLSAVGQAGFSQVHYVAYGSPQNQ